MIYQYTYADIGNRNCLKKIKYSIIQALNSKKAADSIHFDYIRSIGSNPKYFLESFNNMPIKTTQNNFNDKYNINYGYPITSRLRFLDLAIDNIKNNNIESAHISPDLFINDSFDLDMKSFYFYEADSVWWNVPWGFLKIEHAYDFLEYSKINKLLNLEFDECFMYRDSFFYCPKQYLCDFRDKYEKMLSWILNLYKEEYASRAACTCASQIISSFLALNFKKQHNATIKTISDDHNKLKVKRYPSESENDVAGSSKIFF